MYSRGYSDQKLPTLCRYPAPCTKITAAPFDFAPMSSGRYMWAGTCTPSDAVTITIFGAIHFCLRNSALGESVSCDSAAPALFCMTYRSGGRLTYEYTSATSLRSGDIVAVCRPGVVVKRVRLPPVTGREKRCSSKGDGSFVVRSKVRPSGERDTPRTSHLPLVS